MAVINNSTKAQILYFESEGRDNLEEVIKVLRKVLRSREHLRELKMLYLRLKVAAQPSRITS